MQRRAVSVDILSFILGINPVRAIAPRRWIQASLLMFGLLCVGPVSMADEMRAPGILAQLAPSEWSMDTVDPLNGRMAFTIPMYSASLDGGLNYSLQLAYNSNVWKDDESNLPVKNSIVGIGFTLHMGRIYALGSTCIEILGEEVCTWGPWVYEDPLGVSHNLYRRDFGQDNDWWWTHDITSLKATQVKNSNDEIIYWKLWFPDGTLAYLAHKINPSNSKDSRLNYYTTTIEAPTVVANPSNLTVSYDSTYPNCLLSINDSFGRSINFTNSGTLPGGESVLGGESSPFLVETLHGSG